jgi:hypothetical protein
MRQRRLYFIGPIVILLAFALSGEAFSQQRQIEISPFGGYQWSTNTFTNGGELATKNAANFGGAIDIMVQRDLQLELLYIYSPMETRFVSQTIAYPSSQYTDLNVHYMQIGYVRGFKKGKVEPFGAFTLGAVLFSPGEFVLDNGKKITPSDTWRFAMTLGGGAKIFFSEKFGIRLQARLLIPVYFSGAGMYVGTGGGGLAVTGGIPALMGDFTAGLIIAP